MNILGYSKKVKQVKDLDVQTNISTVLVGLKDLQENLSALTAGEIDLNPQAEHWIVTKAILREAKLAGGLPQTIGYVDLMNASIAAAFKTAEAVKVAAKKENVKIWDGATLTIRQTNILSLVEHLNFWMDYASITLDVLITQNAQKIDAERYLNKADVRWINGTRDFFIDFTKMLLKGSIAISHHLEALPSIPVDEETVEVLEEQKGQNSVNLMRKGFGLHSFNPVYWYYSAKEKIDLWRIDNMRRYNVLFAMKINQAINKKNNTNDPQLDRQIEIYQEAIIKNKGKIDQIVASYD